MSERINKYLSAHGICSRREADRLISEGKIFVDGIVAVMGQMVDDSNEIYVEGKIVDSKTKEEIILLCNKPRGIVCTTTNNQGDNNIVDFIGYKERIYPVGRLDKDSDGLIIMTNNGDLMDRILKSVNGHEKEYIVTVNKRIDDTFIKNMSSGIYLDELDRTTNPCKVSRVDDKTFRIVLTQGLNRQIRRMCQALGYKVDTLTRVRIMNLELSDLKVGEYRKITENERKVLFSQIYN